MTTDTVSSENSTWGQGLTILCPSDFRYLPGVYALFNSAILNGFLGKFVILMDSNNAFDLAILPKHPQLSVRTYTGLGGDYHIYVNRLAGLTGLEAGNYLYLDADMIIERPCGHLLEAIDEALVVSTEPEAKYDQFDVLWYNQAKETGLSCNLKPFGYANGGLLGFNIPRHRDFIDQWVNLSLERFRGAKLMSPFNWFFLDQCMLNLLIRQPDAPPAFAISPRQLEFGPFSTLFQDRPFPWTKQGALRPADQTKFIIHGAGMHRPWLPHKKSNLKGWITNTLDGVGLLPLLKQPRPYERAWAFYTCSENLPIPYSAWVDTHSFNKHKNPLWKMAYGIS